MPRSPAEITTSACGVGPRLVRSRLQIVSSTGARETTPSFHHVTIMSRVSRQDRGRHDLIGRCRAPPLAGPHTRAHRGLSSHLSRDARLSLSRARLPAITDLLRSHNSADVRCFKYIHAIYIHIYIVCGAVPRRGRLCAQSATGAARRHTHSRGAQFQRTLVEPPGTPSRAPKRCTRNSWYCEK